MDADFNRRFTQTLQNIRIALDLDAKLCNVKRFGFEHPIITLFLMVTLCMCSIPFLCFATFAVGTLVLCFTGFLIIEGTLLTVASLMLGAVLFLVSIVSVCLSTGLVSVFYMLQVAQRLVESAMNNYNISNRKVPQAETIRPETSASG